MISLNKEQKKGNKREFAGFAGDSRENEIGDAIADEKHVGYVGYIDSRGQDGRSGASTKASSLTGSLTSSLKGHGRIAPERTDKSALNGAEKRATKRGRFDFMQYIHGFIACLLVLLALIHIPFPEPLAWLPYSVAALLAVITLKSELSIPVSRVLAIATTGMMFFFFALFFLVVPSLEANWYTTQYGWAAVCLLLSAFVMIPILSDYSCRLKAECREAREARRTAFFSVPSHINPESR